MDTYKRQRNTFWLIFALAILGAVWIRYPRLVHEFVFMITDIAGGIVGFVQSIGK